MAAEKTIIAITKVVLEHARANIKPSHKREGVNNQV